MHGSWLSLLPFLVVIPISIFTKQVQPGLFVALILGSYLVEPSLLGGIKQALTYVVDNTVKSNNIRIILFLYMFAGLINMVKMAGGIKGFVELVSDKVKTKKSAMILTWVSTMATFSDPDFRIVTIAPIMKALKNRLNMSSRRIGIVIEVTSNPIVALVPIATGFVGYMVTVIGTSLQHAGIHRAPYKTYVESIPFNFFSFVIVLVGLYYTFFMHKKHDKETELSQAAADHDTGDQKASKETSKEKNKPVPSPLPDPTMAKKNAQGENKEQGTGETQLNPQTTMSADRDEPAFPGIVPDTFLHDGDQGHVIQSMDQNQQNFNEEYSRHLDSADIANQKHMEQHGNPNEKQGEEDLQDVKKGYDEETPSRPWNLILPIIVVLLLTLFLSWWDGHNKANSFFGAFIKSDALGVMLEALLITLILTIVFFMFQKFAVSKIVTHFVNGGNQLMSVIVLLTLIWGVSAVSEDLGFSQYITDHVKGWIPSMLVAPVLFLLGALISYFIGSSWGTWGLLMPLGIMLAHQSGSNLLLVIGAVFASGTFGAFASPLSDNTVTLCTIMDLPVMKYARSKLVPALIAAGITALLFAGASFIM
ncbi:Na+/H+ antiporter family protein [Scopulibacillus darangshiensis]|uniref:Na+/H+ antiporter family protein n=1 Tax=Scopulibacillus darangshiensis TaxID=442528 RepID=A0A4R2PB38_9BACL|nr:Na+/H+ antiporter NhaC family protein [Scopulibacillus darangshiensis]TCP32310.1 Na+/H+ antiporter family protein [Scopulibacillus darangshiensis]